jgi:hypothetical protein
MSASLTYYRSMIAPCGMNCGSCIGFLRDKNKCYGCWMDFASKRKSCSQCKIKTCDNLRKTKSKFCYDCESFPCLRLKKLDKRYKTKYKTSLIGNLMMIKEEGIRSFLAFETKLRTCTFCGSALSVHREACLECRERIPDNKECTLQ